MRQLIAILTILLFVLNSSADLLDRVKLEDSIRERVEHLVHTVDPKARVFMDVKYRSFGESLPGTSFESALSDSPMRIEANDISKISVEIFTQSEQLKAELNDGIIKLIPVPARIVDVKYKKLTITEDTKNLAKSRLSPEALSSVAQDFVSKFSRVLILLIAVSGLCSAILIILLSRKALAEFKNQMFSLGKTISESGVGNSGAVQSSRAAENVSKYSPSMMSDRTSVVNLHQDSLSELLADCYWSEQDSYSAWLWKQMSNDQRGAVLKKLPFAREYSFYFLNLAPEEQIYHEHPYYIDPTALSSVSQPDLAKEVQKDFGLWHQISPIRQAHLPLSFQEKLSAMQSKPSKFASTKLQSSTLRSLSIKPTWGELTAQDEVALFKNPKMVPKGLRLHVKSLVWLAQKDEKTIQSALAKFDARTLASIWIGPSEVLKKLEAQLPEKKLKLLETYKEKVQPTRSSDAYLSLVDEGLKDDAA